MTAAVRGAGAALQQPLSPMGRMLTAEQIAEGRFDCPPDVSGGLWWAFSCWQHASRLLCQPEKCPQDRWTRRANQCPGGPHGSSTHVEGVMRLMLTLLLASLLGSETASTRPSAFWQLLWGQIAGRGRRAWAEFTGLPSVQQRPYCSSQIVTGNQSRLLSCLPGAFQEQQEWPAANVPLAACLGRAASQGSKASAPVQGSCPWGSARTAAAALFLEHYLLQS